MEDAGDTYDILRSIRQILRRVSEHSRRLSKDSGLTVPQLLCLKALGELDEPGTVVGIGRAVQMSPSTVSGVLDRLEAGGLIRRERGTDDRRKVFLHLTEAGDEKLRDLPPPLQDVFVARLEALPDEERHRIRDVLAELVGMMDAEEVDAAPILDVNAAG